MFEFSALNRAPVAALLLGLGGLLPFAGLALMVVLGATEPVDSPSGLLCDYAATILAFVGALQWGYAIGTQDRGWLRYLWGVIPALLAWVALQLPHPLAQGVMAAGLIAALAFDATFPVRAQPDWVLPLRLVLSAGAATSLLVAAFFA